MISAIAVMTMLGMAEAAPPPAPAPPPIMRTYPTAPPPPIPPAPPTFVPGTRAKANLADVISSDDYPAAALRANEEGEVGFMLIVGPSGRVTDCSISRSSGSASLDSATCRLLSLRAVFEPARDLAGEPIIDMVRGRIVWRITEDSDRPWAPALFVEELRSTSDGAASCRQGWPPAALNEEVCPAGEAARIAQRARSAGKGIERSIVTWLTPEGMSEAPDRPGRGDLFLMAEAVFTIGADGRLLECRPLRSLYVGRDRPPGAPPGACAGWTVGSSLFVAAAGTASRTVNVKVRGYVGLSIK